jgi:hypothetical protein
LGEPYLRLDHFKLWDRGILEPDLDRC